mmetsp:Transcript_108270/g.198677  ORF Transcript_108270/g.198677 Transcript_108270/m.198677 type:complete len:242 (+) Transcript_108270:88-813(+)
MERVPAPQHHQPQEPLAQHHQPHLHQLHLPPLLHNCHSRQALLPPLRPRRFPPPLPRRWHLLYRWPRPSAVPEAPAQPPPHASLPPPTPAASDRPAALAAALVTAVAAAPRTPAPQPPARLPVALLVQLPRQPRHASQPAPLLRAPQQAPHADFRSPNFPALCVRCTSRWSSCAPQSSRARIGAPSAADLSQQPPALPQSASSPPPCAIQQSPTADALPVHSPLPRSRSPEDMKMLRHLLP